MTDDTHRTLDHLLDALDDAGTCEDVSVQDILDEIGERSIMPVVLVVSILLVSPLSGIPGLPTLSAVILLLVIGQALAVSGAQSHAPTCLAGVHGNSHVVAVS